MKQKINTANPFHYIALLFLVLLEACSGNVQQTDIDRINVEINNGKNKYGFDDFFEYSHHTVLQTTDESLISVIDKLQIKNNKIFIIDRAEKKVLIFDMEGNFIQRIKRLGQSDQEYLSLSDIDIDDNNHIYMNDYQGRKVLKYSLEGDFLASVKVPLKGSSLKILEKNKLIMNLGNGTTANGEDKNYNYICLEDTNVVFKGIPFNENLMGRSYSRGYGKSSFYMCDKDLFMTSMLNDTVYRIDKKGSALPHLVYDFGMSRPSLQASKNEVSQYLDDMRSGKVVSTLSHFNKFGDYYFIQYDYNGKSNYVISKKNSTPEFVGGFDLNKHGLYIFPIACLSDASETFLVTVVFPNNIKPLLETHKDGQDLSLLKAFSEQTEEDDNPILVFYRWTFPIK